MTDYEYADITSTPNGMAIRGAVASSEMTDKDMGETTWGSDTEILTITFDTALSSGDKTLLDGLVAEHWDDPKEPPTPVGLTVISPDSTVWEIKVDNDGVLSTQEVT